ncbi:MAG: hypothetical protein ABSE16_19495 [Verrucomicrobiota bacterium]
MIAGTLLQDAAAMERAMDSYPDCDLADASIIALSERRPTMPVLTCDKRHFIKYRRTDHTPLPIETP